MSHSLYASALPFNALRSLMLGLALVMAMALSGCVAPVGPIEVRRFHVLNDAPDATSARIAVVPAEGFDNNSLEFRAYASAIGRELSAQGYSVVDGTDAPEQLATLAYNSQTQTVGSRQGPVSVGVGGGTGGFRSGVGGGIGFNLGGGSSERIFTTVEVIIMRSADNVRLWEGQAVSEAKPGTPAAEPQIAAAKLASALFSDFPGESGATIEVE
ncbi:MAG: DUF4136 domain-containing protein [Pseudomonadota bacterium]